MKIAVCVKQVPEGHSRIDPGTKRLDRSGEGALNGFDANAVEEALRLKDATGDGEVVLVTDKGEEVLRAGDCAAFPANAPDGHHLINKSNAAALCLEVGTRAADDFTTYPDIDLVFDPKIGDYTHRDGTPYPAR